MTLSKKHSIPLLAVAVALTAWSCGQSSEPTSAIQPVTNAPAGSTGPLPRVCFQGLAPCVPASQFQSTCRYVGGALATRASQPETCIVTREYGYGNMPDLSFYYPNRLPILTPSVVGGGIDTGIRLRQGAKLEYSARRTGKWGYFQESDSSFWGGRIKFSWFGSACGSIDWNGMGRTGQLMNEDQPAGLFGSDGSESFFLGGDRTVRAITIHHEGTLRIGINADVSSPYGCTTAGYPRFRLTTCEDASGVSYTCS